MRSSNFSKEDIRLFPEEILDVIKYQVKQKLIIRLKDQLLVFQRQQNLEGKNKVKHLLEIDLVFKEDNPQLYYAFLEKIGKGASGIV